MPNCGECKQGAWASGFREADSRLPNAQAERRASREPLQPVVRGRLFRLRDMPAFA